MKFIITICSCICFLATSNIAWAQQDAQYTQFMFNKLYFNPAYAGSKKVLSISAIYRKQWLGITGAPQTATLNIHAPIAKQRMGIGLSLTSDKVGFTNFWNIESSYAYRIPVGKDAYFCLGARGTINFLQMRWDKADPTQLMDGSIPGAQASKILPNFGAGIYYDAPKFYVGLSAPRLFKNKIDFTATTTSTIEPRLQQHFFLMGGLNFSMGKKVRFCPNLLLKYTPRTPFDMDLNVSFVFLDKLLLGVTYRMGDSVDGIVQYLITPQLSLSFAYDFTLTKLQRYNAGSIEVMIEYNFYSGNKLKLHNPRFFQ